MAFVFSMVLAQAVFQVIGVASVFPFLALASNPEQMSQHRAAEWLRTWIPGLDVNGLIFLAGLGAVVILLLSNVINMVGEFSRVRYSLRLGQWMRVQMMIRIASRPYAYFLTTNPSLLLKRIGGDVGLYINGVFLPLLDVSVRIVSVILLLVLIIFVDPWIALGAVGLFGTVYLLLLFGLRAKTARISAELKTLNRAMSKKLYQFVSGMKVILVHNKSPFYISGYDAASLRQANISAIIPVISHLPRYLIEPLAFGGLVGVVMILSIQGQDFQSLIPVLGVMAFAGYRLLPALQALYGGLTGIMTKKHAFEEVAEEFGELKPASIPRIDTSREIPFLEKLELDGISFAYAGSRVSVLDGISLEIPRGSSLGIVGTTGSGKSTLIDILMGLHSPMAGTLRVDGRPLAVEDMPSWRGKTGYVPQDIFLLDESIAENIAFGEPPEKIDRERLYEAARAAQILNFIENELPHGFETTVGDRGVRLSGGQRQRVGLARALYNRPEILVLDEATSALDNRTEAELMRAVDSLGSEITLIMVAHRISTVQRCDQIIVLERGRILAKGTFEELSARDEAFQRLVHGQ